MMTINTTKQLIDPTNKLMALIPTLGEGEGQGKKNFLARRAFTYSNGIIFEFHMLFFLQETALLCTSNDNRA